MTEAATAQEITLTRVFEAPRELVWKAWTDPDEIVQWWGPPGWSTPRKNVSMEVRPGGTMRLTSVSGDGTEMTVTGIYREVVEPERLAFEEPAEDSWHEGAQSVVTLADLGDGRTEMVMRTTIQTSDEMREQAAAGMRGTLDRLAEHLA